MANDNIITHFTATDIEKYHRGQLSAKQMHDLEKAALDDPFLADALEGYSVAGVNAAADIADLKNRLGEKVEGAKVIPLPSAPRNSYRALRAAVMILFIAGAGLLVYKLGFDKKNNEVAQNNAIEKEKTTTDTIKNTTVPNGTASTPTPVTATNPNDKEGPAKNERTQPVTTGQEEFHLSKTEGQNGAGVKTTTAPVTVSTDHIVTRGAAETKPGTNPPVKTAEADTKYFDAVAEKKENAAREDYEKAKQAKDDVTVGINDKVVQQNNRAQAAARKADNGFGITNNTTTFRGRVVDADNNGVPFANVTNVQDKDAGTFTDAKGYFNLTYPDSVMNVQVRSLGFENYNVQLRSTVANNQVTLPEDRKNIAEVVLSNQKSNAVARNRDANMKVEEPEPVDGWVYYDAYLANNIEIPEDLKSAKTEKAEVQVSFAVDKNGDPTDVRIEKSDCAKCNKEAIRLVKEGPKFKRAANKKGRTTVTVSF